MAPERSFTNSRKTSKSSPTNYPRDKSSIISGLKLLLKLTPSEWQSRKGNAVGEYAKNFLCTKSAYHHHRHAVTISTADRSLVRSKEPHRSVSCVFCRFVSGTH